MKGLLSRGTYAALLACVLFTDRAHAEASIELFAGGSPYVNTPANAVPVNTGVMAVAPNGYLYLADNSGRMLRFDPSTSSVTSVPNLPGMLEYRFYSPKALNYGTNVLNLIASVSEQWQLDLIDGTRWFVGPMDTPVAATFALDGTLYYTRWDSNAVFKRTLSGTVTTVAGSSTPGFSGDGTTSALFNQPRGLAIDAAGNLFISDSGNQRIRKRAASTGIITTIAGTGATAYNGDNLLANQTNLSTPTYLTLDSSGNLYINEAEGFRIRRLNAATNRVTNFAGNGQLGGAPGDGGLAVNATLNGVADIDIASNGTLYIAEPDSVRVRKVDSNGIISHVVGNGTPSFCGEGVPARQACVGPTGVAIDDLGNVYLSDYSNRRIRKIAATTGLITTIAGGQGFSFNDDGGPASAARFPNGTYGLAMDAARNLYIAQENRVRRIDAVTGVITTVAGTTSGGFSGDGGPAVIATFNGISRLAFDRPGNLYVADTWNNRVRRIDKLTGVVTTVAGTGLSNGPLGDGGAATAASLGGPDALAFDPAGNLIISDVYHYSLRKVNAATGVITTIAGIGSYGYSGNGGLATAAAIGFRPALSIDTAGNIYLVSSVFPELRRIDAPTGIINGVPAPIWGLYTPEGRSFEAPNEMVLGPDNRMYISDGGAMVLRVSGLPTPASDQTPPVIEPMITGTPGNNGWYVGDVRVMWNIYDPESTLGATSGCTSSTVTWDTEGTSFYCRASSAGGTDEKTVVIKRDATPPGLNFGFLSPAPDANGWNNGDVSLPFSTSDATSGVYSTSLGSPLTFGEQGAGLTQNVTVSDFAGNSATFSSPAVNIDRSPAEVAAAISGTAGNGGWYTTDVQVSWTVTDNGSPATLSGCETSNVVNDTTGSTFTCIATSAGGTTIKSVVIKRDATPPALVFGAASPAADANGWRAAPVGVPYTATDATSGVATTSAPSPLSLTTPGSAITAQVVVTDAAGNSATFTTDPYQIDASAPTVTSFVYGTTGTNGWFKTDARVTFAVSDPESVTTSDGCDETTVSTDTAGLTFTCTATSAGGTTSKSVTVKRDATPPTLSWGAPSPGPNAAGWNTTDVSFAFTMEDATSGVGGTSHPSPAVVPFDGPNVSTPITVWDNAGNSTTVSTPPVNIDRAEPVVNYFVSGTPGNNGWYTSDVQVTWQVVKAPENILSQSGCVNTTVIADTSGTTFSCSVTSGAGTTSKSVTVLRDATPPTLQFGAFSPAPNANGWNKTNVTVPFTRADATSGIASTSAASPLTLSVEGAGVTGTVTVTDNAGNAQAFTTAPRNVDKTAPVVTITSPASGANYGFYQDVFADFACTDLSLLSCTGTNAEGAVVNTKIGGAKTFKVTAKDSVAFTVSLTNSFNVAGSFNFEGFVGAAPSPTPNIVRKGSLVPLRWRLPDGNGGFVTRTASFSSVASTTVSCPAGAVAYNDTASGGTGISFSPATNAFTYNWQASSSFTGCKQILITLKDGTQHDLVFKFQ